MNIVCELATMLMRRVLEPVRSWLRQYTGYAESVFRVGLGLVMLAAGLHQLYRPSVWASYVAPVFADIMSGVGVSPTLFMQVNGLAEFVLGVALLAGVYTTIAASLATLGLASIIVNLLITGPAAYVDIIIRDIGILFLGIGVTLRSAADEVNVS